jgi:hypothetical protein
MDDKLNIAISVAAVALALMVWQWAPGRVIDPFFLPTPIAVLGGLWEMLLDGTLAQSITANGASIDCGPEGTTNVLRWFNQIQDTTERNLAEFDAIGGPNSFPLYPWGWAQASNTPLRLYKGYTHGGGVRDPLIVSWPARITDHGAIRHQFHHVTDVTATILEVCGISAPEVFRGVPQIPIHGTSFAYTFDGPGLKTRKSTQYFEMYGHRSIWHDGWKAVTKHEAGTSFEDDNWELYHLEKDFSESRNLAKLHPEKLKELVERWWAEAGKYDVMPLDDRREILFRAPPKPTSIRARSRFVFYPEISAIPAEASPSTQDVSHRIRVEVTLGKDDEGVLVALGNDKGGYALYVKSRRLIYAYNYCGEVTRLVSDQTIGSGTLVLGFAFEKTGILQGIGRLLIGDDIAGSVFFEKTLLRPSFAPMFVGRSGRPPVDDEYVGEFRFSGHIEKVMVEIGDDRELVPPDPDVD